MSRCEKCNTDLNINFTCRCLPSDFNNDTKEDLEARLDAAEATVACVAAALSLDGDADDEEFEERILILKDRIATLGRASQPGLPPIVDALGLPSGASQAVCLQRIAAIRRAADGRLEELAKALDLVVEPKEMRERALELERRSVWREAAEYLEREVDAVGNLRDASTIHLAEFRRRAGIDKPDDAG